MKTEKITLFFTIVSFVIVFLLGSQGFLLKPLFSVDVQPNFSANQTTVNIKNVGFAQAKNAIAQVIFIKIPQSMKNQCYEGIISNAEDKIMKINFSRFSTSVNCQLTYQGISPYDIDSIVVMADDSNGYVWSPSEDFKVKLAILQVGFWVAVSTIIISVASAVTIPYQRRMRKIKEENSRSSETEILNDINASKQELESLEKSLGATTDSSLRDHIGQRMRSLDNKIRELNSELGEVRSKRTIQGKSENLVGEFFLNWGELEQQLVRYSEKKDINPVRIGSSALIRELQRRKVLPDIFVKNFDTVRKFRNELAHGLIIPNEKMIKDYISILKELLETMQRINPSDL
ncbi:MAG: hypothetical protein ACREAD_00620 [Nitrosopumilaceae archaeon]